MTTVSCVGSQMVESLTAIRLGRPNLIEMAITIASIHSATHLLLTQEGYPMSAPTPMHTKLSKIRRKGMYPVSPFLEICLMCLTNV